ncbi:CatB-related O-acetyltransferase [Chryseobacterium herbae]|uniref:CatB-related O-acetyltransferase n=1 Tax=Chryseobacterium herbae TaxID=2976476 RepID=A0ABT2J167_9FLAO|nr:CatB-related O-acetyltransferase [Chryseobacterium sp. pc1-10]MCT2564657.1 CatB-related O-acetyltransferase [Chryseobacterium sp. pc1-10]
MLQKIEYIWNKILKKIRLRAIVDSKIHSTSKVCSGSQLVNVVMGKHSDIGYDCTIINTHIGSFCSLGANIVIGGLSHSIDWVSTSPVFNENIDHLKQKFSHHKFDLYLETNIGHDVWIANNVQIKAGVKVGNGAVIGMGSVVVKDIGPYEIWAGNPAKLIRKRFDDEKVNQLLQTDWYNWDDNKIKKYAPYFNNVELFIKKINE